jgi:hypothetical protein
LAFSWEGEETDMRAIYQVPASWLRKASGLLVPRDRVTVRGTIVAVVKGPDGRVKQREVTKNIVTDDGSQWYAERGPATPVMTEGFLTGIMELGTAGNAPVVGSDRSDMTAKLTPQKAMTSGYPKVNDTDVDNGSGGVDVLTWLAQWAGGEATDAAIDRVLITNTSPGASENCLSYGVFPAPVNKGGSDTLKVFVNHQLVGV